MKIQYQKPLVAVEYFQLSQSIAACITKIGFLNAECIIKDENAPFRMKDMADIGYFLDIHNCDFAAEEMDLGDGICVHTSANATFTS